ncbi:MAG: cupin domain-containing protein [Roseibacillus sp.]
MKITSANAPWSEVSHNSAIKKQVFLANGEVPHITQFARSVFQPSQVASAHSHDDMWEVFLVTSGILTITIDGIAHELEAGASITLAPNETHELRNDGSEELHLTYFGIEGPPQE